MKGAQWWLFRVVCDYPIPRALCDEKGVAWVQAWVRAIDNKTAIVWKNELLETIDAFDAEVKALAVGSRHTERTKERCVILMTANLEDLT